MSKIELHEVEYLTENNILSRVAVPGGWMYRVWDIIINPSEDSAYAALCFVPDPNAPHVRDARRLKLREGWSEDRDWVGEEDNGTLRFIDWGSFDAQSSISFVPNLGYTACHADGSVTDHTTRLEAHDALRASGSESPFVVVTGPAVKAEEVKP